MHPDCRETEQSTAESRREGRAPEETGSSPRKVTSHVPPGGSPVCWSPWHSGQNGGDGSHYCMFAFWH